MEKEDFKLKRVYLIGFFLILALPLLNLPPWFSPPDWGKTIFFRIILSILIFFFICQLLYQKDRFGVVQRTIPRGSAALAFWLLISLLGAFFLATIFSLDRNFSIWGSPYRSGGFINFALYFIFAILAFLIFSKKDWRKIWNFVLIIGILVAIVALLQQFQLFSWILIPRSDTPPSTVGGPNILALYLLLLSFLTLSFGLKEKNRLKKLFYFLTLFLFIIVIPLTWSRAAFIGITFGFFYFLLFYPVRGKSPKATAVPPATERTSNGVYPHTVTRTDSANYVAKGDRSLPLTTKFWCGGSFGVGVYPKKIIWFKVLTLILLVLGISGFSFLKTHPEVVLTKNRIVQNAVNRILSISLSAGEGRVSTWKIAFKALLNRPLLGWGPENFSIGFDKYYDPTLPGIQRDPHVYTSWWDKAHNIIFDIGVPAGIPALIIYLSLFGALFWQFQRLKSAEKNADSNAEFTPKVIYHGIQATFLAYLVADLFTFDGFSTYLILFLLFSFSLHLISQEEMPGTTLLQSRSGTVLQRFQGLQKHTKILTYGGQSSVSSRRGGIVISFLFIILIWFIWAFNIKPFKINKEINLALYESRQGYCESAVARMEKILPTHSFLDNYLRLKYVDIIDECLRGKSKLTGELVPIAVEILKENIKTRPTFTRNWLLLGSYTNMLIEKGEVNLKKEADYCFSKAMELSPKRQETLVEWLKSDLLTKNYQEAKNKAEKCIATNDEIGDCWWYLGLTNLYLKEEDKAKENFNLASQKGYITESQISLLQLAKVYGDLKEYQRLVKIYQTLIEIESSNVQYYASLAFVYKELGEIEKAREYALLILQIMPEAREDVERFLRELSPTE